MTLTELGSKYGTDKGNEHSYLDIYEELFEPFRNEPIQLLELGVANGCSLRMWLEWFPNALVSGVDNNEKLIAGCFRQMGVFNNRYALCCCEQDDDKRLRSFCGDGEFQIVIDDAGHDPKKQMLSFLLLWRAVKPGGFYIVEDIPSDHWAEYWEGVPGATVYRNHKNGREDDILVIIKKPL